MLSKLIRKFLLVSVILFSANSSAVIIEYEISLVGGNTYQYDYTVINDDLAAGVEEITIYFDFTLFENLTLPSFPTDWDGFVLQPDLLLPDDGIYDSFFLVAPLALGSSLSGFSVWVDFLGTGTPGSQFFEVYDFNFDVVAAGNTILVSTPPPTVPEPGSLALLIIGLGLAGRVARQK